MGREKIKSLQDIEKFHQKLLSSRQNLKARVLICMTGCRALGAKDVCSEFHKQLKRLSLDKHVAVVETGCIGMCARAPVMLIEPHEYLYGRVTPEDVKEIISTTIQDGKPLGRLAVIQDGKPVVKIGDIDFYKRQNRKVLENCGRIDPRSIENAIEYGGYINAIRALTEKQPQQIIDEVIDSGLRGRGGAGFPTGVKWSFARKSPGDEKYLICNADEGDPGAFMDRALLEGDPHRVIEGMIIAAYAIGAAQGFIYVRAEYPIAVEHINIALEQARTFGLLGDNIAGTGFNFDIEVRMGAGAFVCGEETALIASLEGKRGMPVTRPPFPAESGYKGKPTNINNVETFTNVAVIFKDGVKNYNKIGTEKSKGTKIFALAGKVNNTGLVEVPMGATLREIIFDIGGGIPGGRKFKAAQMGGPSGGCIPAEYLDTEIDYDSVQQIGAIMGSGGLIVMDENTCMVDVARHFLQFVQTESCGKNTTFRAETENMLHILDAISRGEASLEDLDRLELLAECIKKDSQPWLGQTAPNPVLSTLRHFREEYEEHIVLKTCRAAVCDGLVRAPCQHACPAGVNVPEYLALASEGHLTEAANIIRRRNPFVSVCGRVCDHPCERRCRRSEIDQPLAIRALKRYIADYMEDFDTPIARPTNGQAEVAIIGSGPAGLSCAYFLALMQRPSVIFEAQPIPGGMLSLGIPEFRLPKDILNKEIGFIFSHGVQLKTETRIDNALNLLKDGFKAVFVATGCQRGKTIDIAGNDLNDVIDALEFLRDRGLGKGMDCEGKRIVVIGGGNAAVDVARSAVRLGAKEVTILYRRTRNEMSVYDEEIDSALEEGVKLVTLGIPNRVISKGQTISAIEFLQANPGKADTDGRRRPVPIEGSETKIECDIVIPAIGQVASTESVNIPGGPELTKWGMVKADPVTYRTSVDAIFSGGDCVTGPASVIGAISDGQKAAVSIDKELGGSGNLPEDIGFSFTKPDKEALAEAGKCFRCDLEK